MLILRGLIILLLVKPVAYLVLGLSVVGRRKLVRKGPAIIAANHNSHLDTALLYALFPVRLLPSLRPVAAADYFLSGPISRWLSINIIGILPIDRDGGGGDPLEGARRALARNEILFLFPEGSRGAPEEMSSLKSGVARLAEAFPDVPIVPVFMRGAGQSLPKGSRLFVPYRCHAAIGAALFWTGDKSTFMDALKEAFLSLSETLPSAEFDDEDGDEPADRPAS